MSNDNQIPTALEFLHRDESGVYNEVDIAQAMIEFAKLHVAQALLKASENAGKEMSYADGYKEGYNRAIELTKWTISNLIPPPL